MNKQKHRYKLHLSVGEAGLCPDCGEETPFRRASLLGECEKGPWTIDAFVLRALSASLKKLVCKTCRGKPAKLHWIDLGEGAVLGPYCSTCLREQRDDLPVYVAPSSQDTLRHALFITKHAPPLPAVTSSDAHLF